MNNIEDQDKCIQIGEMVVNLSEQIGKGNFSTVYLGYNLHDEQKIYAVKYFNQESQTTNNEVGLISEINKINCPFIVKTHYVKRGNSGIYIFMDLCEDGNLSEFIAQKNKIGQIQSIEFFKQIVYAFQVLYDKKIVHRDLKPANILIHDGICKLSDFGLGQKLKNQNPNDTDNQIAGTPAYMAPELLEMYIELQKQQKRQKQLQQNKINQNNAQTQSAYSSNFPNGTKQNLHISNQKCDVWSLGLIFYEMLQVNFYIDRQYSFYLHLINLYKQQLYHNPFFTVKNEPYLNENFVYDDNNISEIADLLKVQISEFASQLKEKIKQNLIPKKRILNVLKIYKNILIISNLDNFFNHAEDQVQQFYDYYEKYDYITEEELKNELSDQLK
ncbi:Protein kinase-like domain [Pseudocohnilembus persalinus]|uniref:Protein kinase-like domain n=1 Tax=Pseudocohnilembus persalinus TaxID=266149 RepID=A0A0V0QIE5_PSEPJ|nr:Protein kinase-like domain [Pseudocohnilembus persalinus]|eukprot:KRX01988.1 Protein kinase-like domain [Pseudocohnilembus persalinus]